MGHDYLCCLPSSPNGIISINLLTELAKQEEVSQTSTVSQTLQDGVHITSVAYVSQSIDTCIVQIRGVHG